MKRKQYIYIYIYKFFFKGTYLYNFLYALQLLNSLNEDMTLLLNAFDYIIFLVFLWQL